MLLQVTHWRTSANNNQQSYDEASGRRLVATRNTLESRWTHVAWDWLSHANQHKASLHKANRRNASLRQPILHKPSLRIARPHKGFLCWAAILVLCMLDLCGAVICGRMLIPVSDGGGGETGDITSCNAQLAADKHTCPTTLLPWRKSRKQAVWPDAVLQETTLGALSWATYHPCERQPLLERAVNATLRLGEVHPGCKTCTPRM